MIIITTMIYGCIDADDHDNNLTDDDDSYVLVIDDDNVKVPPSSKMERLRACENTPQIWIPPKKVKTLNSNRWNPPQSQHHYDSILSRLTFSKCFHIVHDP